VIDMSGRLHGKVALVTGGSRGIGRATALRLAADGAAIILNYATNDAAARDVQAHVRAQGGEAELVQADITALSEIPRLFDAASARFGKLDILVNNAGIGGRGSVASTPEAAYDRLFAVTKGVFFTLQAGAERIADSGRIISLSTGLTRGWAAGVAAYAGSKAAIEQFSRSLSKDLGPRGITVNVVLPGVTETDMTANMPSENRQHFREQTSLGRLGRPEDIADIIAFLASDDGRWITGQLIVANGGSTP
jgi:3-oxoacyl-[acyl-carrier protein] reductase